jgi:glycosyltransferase involved in cell wall biosynthesis
LFENPTDRDRLIRAKVVRPENTVIVGGTGVDINKFTPMPEEGGTPVIVLACRMLWDKGVGDFVEAARLLSDQKVPGRFVLIGTPDAGNPASIPEAQLLMWQREGIVEWWGYRENMPEVLASAHVVVLPSFHEGLPKILLEAGACARPVVATAIPGCTEIVRDGENGILVPPKDPVTLAKAIKVLLENPILRRRMGKYGREIVVREYSADLVADQILAVYHGLIEKTQRR